MLETVLYASLGIYATNILAMGVLIATYYESEGKTHAYRPDLWAWTAPGARQRSL